MSKLISKVSSGLAKVEKFTKKKSPSILAGTAIAGTIVSAYSWFKAGPKVDRIMNEYHENMKLVDPRDKQTISELKRAAAADIALVVSGPTIMTGVTIGCIAGSHSQSSKRIAALSAAYTISESTVKNLETKMDEILGEKKVRQVKDAIIKDKFKTDNGGKTPPESQIIVTGKGDVMCKDMYTGRFFRSNAQIIESAVAKLSYNMLSEMYISLNDFYSEINLEPIRMGDDLGWNIDDTHNGQIPITITAILTEEKMPCLCIDYDAHPRADYRNLR